MMKSQPCIRRQSNLMRVAATVACLVIYAYYACKSVWSKLKRSPKRYYIENYDHVKIEKSLILLESFAGRKIACNPYAIFRALQSLEGSKLKFIWVINEGCAAPEDVRKADNVVFVKRGSKSYSNALLSAETVISNSTLPSYFTRKPGQRYWNTWHGVPIKKMGLDADRRLRVSQNVQHNFIQASGILLASEYAAEATVKPYLATALTMPNVKYVGSPRIDLTLSTSREYVRNLLNIKGNGPLVLFAPTWRGDIENIKNDIKAQLEAVTILRQKFGTDTTILLSLHHFVRQHIADPKLNAIHVPEDLDINLLLAGVDILVSDYSSVIIDFLVLDRPVISYVPDFSEYNQSRGLYIDLSSLPIFVCRDADALANAQLKKPSSYKSYQSIINRLIPLEDGHASRRAAQIILGSCLLPTQSSDKKRILLLPGGMLNNGITQSFLNLVRSIDRDRFAVSVLINTRHIDGDSKRRAMFDCLFNRDEVVLFRGAVNLPFNNIISLRILSLSWLIHNVGLSSKFCQAFKRVMRELLSDTYFNVSVDFGGYSIISAMLALSANSGRCVIYQHNDLWAEASNVGPARNQRQLHGVFVAYSKFDAVVSVSPEICDVNFGNLSHYYASRSLVTSVRNVLCCSRLKEKLRSITSSSFDSFGLSPIPCRLRFICAARLSPEKNYERLLKAFSLAVSKGMDAELILAGDGPLRHELYALVSKLNIQERTIFTGLVDNALPLMKSSDCFVLASDYEGQPMVLLEALAMGLPCIATDVPGNRSVLGGGLGTLVEPSVEAFAEAMLKFSVSDRLPVNFDAEEYDRLAMQDFYGKVCGIDTASEKAICNENSKVH